MRRSRLWVAAVLCWVGLCSQAAAVGQEFIPLENWAYDALERFEALGMCVLPEDRPFTRTEFNQIVTDLSKGAWDRRLAPRDRYNLARLEKEFTEFASLRDPQYRYDPPTIYVEDSPLLLEGDIDVVPSYEESFETEDPEGYVQSNPSMRVHFGERVTYDVRYRLIMGPEHGNRIRDRHVSPRERSFNGLTSLYERATLVVAWDKVHAFIGREYVDWGPADWGSLIVPGDRYSLDQVGARVRLKSLRLSMFHAQLSPVSRRYLAGHRLEFRWRRTVIGFSETAIYGGKDVDPVYFSPLSSFYSNQFNERGDDNVLWSVDAKTSLYNVATLYGSALIDDAQFERDGVSPDKIAWDTGARVAVSYPIAATLRARYRFVDIFTYSHKDSINAYVSGEGKLDEGDVLLGGEPGPDTATWRLEAETYPLENAVVRAWVFGQRRGEGNDLRPHIPPADPDPHFPLGITERTIGFGVELRWEFDRNRWVSGSYSRATAHNFGNVPDLDRDLEAFRVAVHWEII